MKKLIIIFIVAGFVQALLATSIYGMDRWSAAAIGDCAMIQKCIDAGYSVNEPHISDNLTPLHFAASNGHEKIVKALLDAGAHVNVKDDLGNTPLHLSAAQGHFRISMMLLGAGADATITNNSNQTPIDTANHNKKLAFLIKSYFQTRKQTQVKGEDSE